MNPEEEYTLGPGTKRSELLKAFIDLEWHKLDGTDTSGQKLKDN
jgi:hypothetical protein